VGKKKKKKIRPAEKRSEALQPSYDFGQVLLANVAAWGFFLVMVLVVEKYYTGGGRLVWPFYSFLGIGFAIGTFLDYFLERSSKGPKERYRKLQR